jgi:hypothetical protein
MGLAGGIRSSKREKGLKNGTGLLNQIKDTSIHAYET